MIRIQMRKSPGRARNFCRGLHQCRRIEFEQWRKVHPFWLRLKRRLAYYLLVRIDPNLARRQWRSLPE